MFRSVFAGALAAGTLFAVSVQAQEAETAFTPEFSVGLGYVAMNANELVFDNAGNRISRLNWDTDTTVLNLGVKTQLENGMTVTGRAQVGLGGDSYMVDYDWLSRFGFADERWSDYSEHPDTRMERYLSIDVALGRDYVLENGTAMNLHGGLSWTNAKWSARGGSYIYTDDEGNFRALQGDFPDGVRVISYEQTLPTLFGGATFTREFGALTLNGTLRGGFTINASATDHHLLRGLRFEESAGVMPFASISVRGDYKVNETTALYIGAEYSQHFEGKNEVTVYDNSTGARLVRVNDGGGMDLRRLGIEAGAVLRF